jgi:hypothetical protein
MPTVEELQLDNEALRQEVAMLKETVHALLRQKRARVSAFETAQQEVYQRMHAPPVDQVDAFVRAFYAAHGEAPVSVSDVYALAQEHRMFSRYDSRVFTECYANNLNAYMRCGYVSVSGPAYKWKKVSPNGRVVDLQFQKPVAVDYFATHVPYFVYDATNDQLRLAPAFLTLVHQTRGDQKQVE